MTQHISSAQFTSPRLWETVEERADRLHSDLQLESVGVTATRRVATMEPVILQALAEYPRCRFVVGGCRGGDCLVARQALLDEHLVHTVLPANWDQLCPHWRLFTRHGGTPPHTTTWEQMPPAVFQVYRRRNERIVELSTRRILAFPDHREQEAYSGTTMTINIARRARKHADVRILHPLQEGVR